MRGHKILMINESRNKSLKYIMGYSLIIFFIFSYIHISKEYIRDNNLDEIKRNGIMYNEEQLINLQKVMIMEEMDKLVSDLLYISDTLKISNNRVDYQTTIDQIKSFSNRKEDYDQIRFIDKKGDELLRVDYLNNEAYEVDKSKLQNKSDRYYFKESMKLQKNQVYISKLDLNIENNKIQMPIKPMIRLSTPYYSESDSLEGIVIINYLGEEILNQILELSKSSYGSVYLLNSNGYWLFNSEDKNKEWGFMYESKNMESFKNDNKKEWDIIISNDSGNFKTDKGIFTFSNVFKNGKNLEKINENYIDFEDGDWHILSYIPSSLDYAYPFYETNTLRFMYIVYDNLVLLLLLFVVSIIVSIALDKARIKRESIKYFSEYDSMTEVYNRRVGLEKLSNIYNESIKNKEMLSLCFIDVNGLKEINDTLGHDVGDELIRSVSKVIKNNIRKCDFISRIGGDEFLIVFKNKDIHQSEIIYERIVKSYEYINKYENRKYIISLSHGIETISYKSNKNIEEAINLADNKMYEEKTKKKKTLRVIK